MCIKKVCVRMMATENPDHQKIFEYLLYLLLLYQLAQINLFAVLIYVLL